MSIIVVVLSLFVACVLGATNITNCYITSYGFNDNSPPSDEIAYPTVKHGHAVETNGTYNDPCTFASDAQEFAPGTIIYVPALYKYYIMEDDCEECDSDWKKGKHHVDLWIGPDSLSDANSLYACEDRITQNSGEIIVDPPANLKVKTSKIYIDGVCNP